MLTQKVRSNKRIKKIPSTLVPSLFSALSSSTEKHWLRNELLITKFYSLVLLPVPSIWIALERPWGDFIFLFHSCFEGGEITGKQPSTYCLIYGFKKNIYQKYTVPNSIEILLNNCEHQEPHFTGTAPTLLWGGDSFYHLYQPAACLFHTLLTLC